MKLIFCIATILVFSIPALGAPQDETEKCGWLVLEDGALVARPDSSLLPDDPGPLSTPAPQAKAAYCNRSKIMTYVGDQRVVELGLPLLIRSGDREAVLEATPNVLFGYHREGEKYLPNN